MCGITGWVDWTREMANEQVTLEGMMEKLALRGPDAKGTYFSSHAALGHRRLSVVDLEGGRQPMVRARGEHTYAISYNGELYNTDDLRNELITRGHRFSSSSDTEVLLACYMEWGPDCLRRLNGIFAFGVWDEKQQQLFLARDRLGVKPLFYAERDGSLIFGSEIKALLAHPAVKPEVDSEGLAEIFMLGPARTPGHGVFKGVAELRPGYYAIFSREGLSLRQYWALQSRPHEDGFRATVERVGELFEDAVRRQLVSDVPLCALLSGGLDSSAIVAVAAAVYCKEEKELHTFSVDYENNAAYFQENSFQPESDAPWVAKVAGYFGTTHHNIVLNPAELAEVLPTAAYTRDLPGMADIDTSLYLFSREIKQLATVGLSGECADEVFGGYPWFYRPEMLDADTFPWAPQPDQRLAWLHPELRACREIREYPFRRYTEALGEVPRLPGEEAGEARIREVFYLSLTRWMPTLLDRKDRMSMAFGLELRVPFCDHRLVEYVWNVPWPMKNYQQREKGLLRQALTGLLPAEILWRKKSPYPKTYHPAYVTAVREQLQNVLADPSSRLRPLIDRQHLTEFINSQAVFSPLPWFGQLMGGPQMLAYLLQVEAWLQRYNVSIV